MQNASARKHACVRKAKVTLFAFHCFIVDGRKMKKAKYDNREGLRIAIALRPTGRAALKNRLRRFIQYFPTRYASSGRARSKRLPPFCRTA